MLSYIHHLVANFVCLLLSTAHIVCSGFLELFYWKKLPAASGNNADVDDVDPLLKYVYNIIYYSSFKNTSFVLS